MIGVFVMTKNLNLSRKNNFLIKQKLSRLSEFPNDVTLGVPILTMMGQMELCLENFRGLTEYTDTYMRIRTKYGQIKVCGNNLNVEYYRNDEMKVSGNIISIEYIA